MQEFIYVSSVEGRIVTRFASLRQAVAQYVGARRLPGKEHRGKKIAWNTEEVVAIPVQEWRRYSREYRSAVATGALTMKDKAAHEQWRAKQKAASEEHAQAQEEARAKAEAAAKPEPDQAEADKTASEKAAVRKAEAEKKRAAKKAAQTQQGRSKSKG